MINSLISSLSGKRANPGIRITNLRLIELNRYIRDDGIHASDEQCRSADKAKRDRVAAHNREIAPTLRLVLVVRLSDNVALHSSFWGVFRPQHKAHQRHPAGKQKTDRLN
jgi:hypothetical protein